MNQESPIARTCLRRTLLRIVAVLVFWIAAAPAFAQSTWTGTWDTRWRGGGAILDLRQDGSRVTGTYPLYGGTVEAEVRGRDLEGRWQEGDRFGRFLFVQSEDGASFMGRFDTGEWWTGGRVGTANARLVVDQGTPRRAMRTFLAAANRARAGDVEAWGAAAAVVDFGEAGRSLRPGQRLAAAQALADALDLTTFRLWSIPGRSAAGDDVEVELPQAGTEVELPLSFRRRDGRWSILNPPAEALEARVRALRAARGGAPPPADAYLSLRSARDVFLTLLDRRAPEAARLAAFDLSGIAEPVRVHEGNLAAEYLRQILLRIGPVLPTEVPDDPAATQPYVHFEHPAGRIAVTRDPTATNPGDPPRWRVSRETVASLRALYAASEAIPPDPEAASAAPRPTGFFALRERIGGVAPALLSRVGPVEAWQIVGILLLLPIGWFAGYLLAWPAVAGLRWATAASREDASPLRWPVRLAAASALWLVGTARLGLPEVVQGTLVITFTVTLALAAVWGGWHLIDLAARRLHGVASRSNSQFDEIMVSLVAGAAKLGLVVAGLLYLADAFGIPAAGVVAGLGVGGIAFAFASRETLSNVFGAGILLTDRPFRRGDWIVAGDVKGTVEKVGIRSTRVRTSDDSLVVVPNGKLADATINNLGTRRHRLANGKVTIGWTATPAQVDDFVEGVREILATRGDVAQGRTQAGATGLGTDGVEVEFSAYLAAATATEERAAKHAILRDVLALAHRLSLPACDPPAAPDIRWAALLRPERTASAAD
ncbi:mechanosensitive ion channel family protein [Roseomonas sp. CCTCC AB2023176]|uniref:mechanosensitive ion channel family protein n=1 Tax=Roseomonas sp. CCTCC AB2023176 TaxID=3342640 RepID=UPI0035E1AFCC